MKGAGTSDVKQQNRARQVAYKPWAPQGLRERHRKLLLHLQEKSSDERRHVAYVEHLAQNLAILEKLITRDEMHSVWRSLSAKSPIGRESDFVDACEYALTYDQTRTKAEMRDYLNDGARRARELAQYVDEVFGHGGLFGLIPRELLVRSNPAPGNELTFRCAFAYIENVGLVPAKDESILSEDHVLLQDALQRVAKQLEAVAAAYAADGLTVTKPGAATAPRTYFIISLTEYLRRTYGRALRNVVANTATVLFDTTTTVDDVRRAAP